MKLIVPLLLLAGCADPTRFHAFTVGDEVSFASTSELAFVEGKAPARWAAADFDDTGWQRGQTRMKREAAGTAATLYVRARFDAGPQAQQMSAVSLDLDIHGAHFEAMINGVPAAKASARFAETVSVPAGTLRPTGNVLALSLSPKAGEPLSIGIEVDPVNPARAKGIVRGPYLQGLREDGVTVVFDTATEVPGRVVVGERVFTGPAATHHEIAVRGLPAATRHRYHVEAGTARSEELDLQSGPARGEPVTLVVYGDTRTDGDAQRRLCNAMQREGVDFALATGDLVDESNPSEWEAFFTIEYAFLARTPLYSAVGNHDNEPSGAAAFRKAFAYPTDGPITEQVYGFDVGDVHVAVLDSNAALGPQATWLDADLAAARARGAKHLFLVLHHGPYSAGDSHGGSGDVRAAFVPVALRHGVDAVFSGHDHIYERGKAGDLRYFVSGGGGAPLDGVDPLPTTERAMSERHYLLVQVAGGQVTVEAKSHSGQVLDRVTF